MISKKFANQIIIMIFVHPHYLETDSILYILVKNNANILYKVESI